MRGLRRVGVDLATLERLGDVALLSLLRLWVARSAYLRTQSRAYHRCQV